MMTSRTPGSEPKRSDSTMHISAAFDSGNIEVVAVREHSADLRIRPDAGGDHLQWFHFRVTGARDRAIELALTNAADASYPQGWPGYRACASYDREQWFRVETAYEDGMLRIRHTPELDSAYYAYFAPYDHTRHLDLIADASTHPDVRYARLGATVDGRDIDLLQIGDANKPPLWIIARQHPGESMAEWLMEGLVERLLDDDDPVARALRARCCVYAVPNMNPDGAYRGHLRNNAAGVNLNRAWSEPSEEQAPEVFFVRAKMEETGVAGFLDVHGDEALPYNFIAGAEGTPSWSRAKAGRQARYLDALVAASPDFQTTHGYPVARPGKANMAMATNWVGERFGCLAMTLEQPFKDTADAPHPDGWSPPRAMTLGRAQLDAWLRVLDTAR